MILAASFLFALQAEPPRLRTQLPNRATILVERLPAADYVSVQIWINSASFPDRFATHGYRHLLEHFQAKGFDNRLDYRLESKGMLLDAETTRDAIKFGVRCQPSQVKQAIRAIGDVLRPRLVTKANIEIEANIIREEIALRAGASQLSADAWLKAFGESGLDPYGNPDVLAKAEPIELQNTWVEMTSPENLALVIAGNVEIDPTTELAKELLGTRKAVSSITVKADRTGINDTVARKGSAIAAKVASFREPGTAARIAAGLAIANLVPASYFQYGPSNVPGLVLVGSDEKSINWVDIVVKENPDDHFSVAKKLVDRWVEIQTTDPARVAALRGRLLAQSPSLRPETLLENLRTVTVPQFREAWKSFNIEVRP